MTSDDTTPRFYSQIFCGTNQFVTVNHNIVLSVITTLIYNDKNMQSLFDVITEFDPTYQQGRFTFRKQALRRAHKKFTSSVLLKKSWTEV
jgi:hypothetical protein